MKPTNRRQFIQHAAALAGAVSIAPSLNAAGANAKFVIGVIGPGGMGSNHLRAFAGYQDVEVAFVCDPDENRRNAAARAVEKSAGKAPQSVKDMRRVFEDKAVDAVVIATPDDWHVPASLLALEAGKHVYVEKPCSHNIREGRLPVEIATRLGAALKFDPVKEQFVGNDAANQLLRRRYRDGHWAAPKTL
jgi:ornithine cyclodeaminase/alanine dehydrogenase-like protein (mu-crystallin family)